MGNEFSLEGFEKKLADNHTPLPSSIENNPEEPIMVVLTNDNFIHWAGQPKKPTAAEWREWSQPGYQVITMTIKQFRQASFKWIYDKKQTNEQ